ncbi:hypothetical protein MSAN_01992600 [Mycena sanguinolenta]|uniref:Uncharacterized protein n=1 Tax=Mycena sanguinolenta TaxID=230812 RepID=A0A8H7CM36_9AGAR|nr:hypothetical protein MSAN_01992600 [Mycena sanguinolenta]
MYSARVVGHNKPMTVALYQGHNSQKEWRRDFSYHSDLRHPHIVQIYATAGSSGIHATVFHDDLIPYEQFLESFRHSAILRAYISAYTEADENDAYRYYSRMLSTSRLGRTFWIRRSTGRLCIEFSTLDEDPAFFLGPEALSPPQSIMSLHHPNQEALFIGALPLSEWYFLCSTYLSCRFEDSTEIASVADLDIICSGWHHLHLGRLDDDSLRCNAADVIDSAIYLFKCDNVRRVSWFSQANYIFKQLRVDSNYEEYVIVTRVIFVLEISATTEPLPDGYLFLCSPTDFETAPASFRWPDVPAYWSLDPSGSTPLNTDEASSLGFPSMTLKTEVHAKFWDDSVYAGLRKFHKGKGFDPDSRDVAWDLGYPLYQLSVPVPGVTEQNMALDARRDDQEAIIEEITFMDGEWILHRDMSIVLTQYQ